MNYLKLWAAIVVPAIVFGLGFLGFDATPDWTAAISYVGTALLVWRFPNVADPAP